MGLTQCPSATPYRYPDNYYGANNRCFAHKWGGGMCNVDPQNDPYAHQRNDVQCNCYTPPLTSTWTKHQNLYCHSYAYKDGGHWFSEASAGAALQRCADDSGCAGIGEWNCGDGQYRYCGQVGWGLGNYGAGRCTWERPRPWD